MQPAERGDPLGAGAQHQVVGVAEDDPSAGRGNSLGGHRLDRAGRGERHEDRRVDEAVRGGEPPAPRRAVARQYLKPGAHGPSPM